MELIGVDTVLASYFLHHPEKKNSVTLGTIYKLKEVFEAEMEKQPGCLAFIDFRSDEMEHAIMNNSYFFDWQLGKTTVTLRNRSKFLEKSDYFTAKLPAEIREKYIAVSTKPEIYTQVDTYLKELAKKMGWSE